MANHKVVKTSDIKVTVGLNDANIPVQMHWQAQDGAQGDDASPCKAMLLSLFDANTKDTLKIDLWTQDMQVAEMDRFFFQTLRGMADTYFKATQNQQLAADFQRFVHYFGEKTELIK